MMVMGCDFGQGVLIAPPMPMERFLDLLRQRMNKARPQQRPAAGIAARNGTVGRVA